MLKQFYKYMAALLLVGIVISCSPDALDVPLTEGDVPVELTGMLTRALGDTDDPGHGGLITTGNPLKAYSGRSFYLSARTTDAPPANYFLNQKITIGADATLGRNELEGTVYYPLGQKAINLIAHTGGTATDAGVITLNAGTAQTNDYLFGKGTLDDGATLKSGTSVDPIGYITFKHLMTRVDVKIEVADEVEPVKPTSMTMRFAHNAGQIVNRGTYNIFTDGNTDGNAVNNPTGTDFSFTNIGNTATPYYLVPNGANLTTYDDQIVSYLKINDYEATDDDLKTLKFSKAKKGTEEVDFELKPGLAYDLTFVIKRLKIVDIQLTLKDWTTVEANTEWDYQPKTLELTTNANSDFAFSGGNEITQMVLRYKHNDDKVYQYIGDGKMDGDKNVIDFVTLPADLSTLAGQLTADLYTKDGLLVDNIDITPSESALDVVDLGEFGMKKKDDVLEITTPLQFALMLNADTKPQNQTYSIAKTIDMGGTKLAITPKEFPSGSVLDGNGQEILNLEISGNGLFTENNGTLKNFRIVSGQITGSGTIGAICQTNNGTIEAVVNQANILPSSSDQIAGGIAGTNGQTGTIIASVNTGNILGGTTVGGIVGQNINSAANAITACINVGMLHKEVGETGLLGGIVGSSVVGTVTTPIVNTSYWLTGTARKNQGVSDERAIGDSAANGVDDYSADLAESSIRDEGNAINKLNSAIDAIGSSWKFVMDPNISSWPIAIPK